MLNVQPSPFSDSANQPLPVATVDLSDAAAVQRACAYLRRAPQPSPALYIDCGQLRCQRTLGVSYVISQLLALRRAGATVWLRNPDAPLRRCLQLLQLDSLFRLADAASPEAAR